MTDYQPSMPPESEDQSSKPTGRRGNLGWALGCLTLVIILVIAAVAAFNLVSRAGEDQGNAVTEGEVLPEPEETAGPAAEPSAVDPAQTTPSLPEDNPTTESPASLEPEPAATAEQVATQSPATPTAEPVATDPPAAAPLAAERNGRIAIVDERSRLWTVATDGSDRRLLSEQGRVYQFPSWSPAGNDIAVIGSDRDSGGVYVVADEDATEMRQLYSDSSSLPIYLYWSPAGESVSFIANHPEGLALHLAPTDESSTSELVATSPSTFFWDWMPDGSQVLVHTGFTARDADDSRLAFIPLDGRLDPTEVAQNGFFQAPAVASDGRFYSYGDEDPTGRRWLTVWDIDQNQQVELIFHQGVVAMGFSPTRAQLAYTSPERPALSFYGPLRLLDLESGDSRLLVPETVLAYFWSPDGRSIAYLTLTEIDKPFDFGDAPVAKNDDGVAGPIASPPSPSKIRTLSKIQTQPDEESRLGLALSIVNVDSGQSRRLTVFEPSDVFLNQFLPFFDQYALSHRLWSPDSDALVLPMKDENERDFIVVVPVDGTEPATIAHGVVAFWSQQ